MAGGQHSRAKRWLAVGKIGELKDGHRRGQDSQAKQWLVVGKIGELRDGQRRGGQGGWPQAMQRIVEADQRSHRRRWPPSAADLPDHQPSLI